MATLSLADAFAKLGGRAANRLHSRSAIAADGALILSCSAGSYHHPAPGVLRYEDRLSREEGNSAETRALGQHLTLALDGSLPIRMIVVRRNAPLPTGKSTQNIHVRDDLVGKLVKFDGDHFVVDFTRAASSSVPAERTKSQR
jgi:hypothetical protein